MLGVLIAGAGAVFTLNQQLRTHYGLTALAEPSVVHELNLVQARLESDDLSGASESIRNRAWFHTRNASFYGCMARQRWLLWFSTAHEYCAVDVGPPPPDWEPPGLPRVRESVRPATAPEPSLPAIEQPESG